MANPYSIDFNADLTGPLGLLGQAIRAREQRKINRENAETQRKYADANMAIASARAKREEAEFAAKQQERQHALDVERSQQLGPLGAIARRMSPEFATEMGKPYGISFTQGQPQGHVQSPFANADFGEHAKQTLAGGPEQEVNTAQLTGEAAAGLGPGEEGPEANPYSEALRFPGTEQPQAPAMEGPEYDPVAQESERLSHIQRPLLVSVAGRQFELPEMQGGTGLGKEYDDMYDRLIMTPGVKPGDAMKAVYAEHQKNAAEEGRMTRAANMLDQRNSNREDTQAFTQGENAKYRNEGISIADRDRWEAGRNRARVAAAGSTTNPGIVEVLRSVEEGAPLSETAKIAAEKKIPSKAYSGLAGQVVRNAATAERAGQKREGLQATGPGIPPGSMWKNSQAATKGTQQVQRFHRVEERLKALIADVEQHGERIDLDTDQYVNRRSLAEAAAAALRPYNELSSTDASMEAERAIIGPTGAFGHGWVLGANLTTLKRILSEAQGQQRVNLETLLRPGGGSQLSPALGGQRSQGGHPSEAPVGETRQGPDGRTYRKVGPNNWQPVGP